MSRRSRRHGLVLSWEAWLIEVRSQAPGDIGDGQNKLSLFKKHAVGHSRRSWKLLAGVMPPCASLSVRTQTPQCQPKRRESPSTPQIAVDLWRVSESPNNEVKASRTPTYTRVGVSVSLLGPMPNPFKPVFP